VRCASTRALAKSQQIAATRGRSWGSCCAGVDGDCHTNTVARTTRGAQGAVRLRASRWWSSHRLMALPSRRCCLRL